MFFFILYNSLFNTLSNATELGWTSKQLGKLFVSSWALREHNVLLRGIYFLYKFQRRHRIKKIYISLSLLDNLIKQACNCYPTGLVISQSIKKIVDFIFYLFYSL